MFILYGRRPACIKKDTDYHQTCSSCNSIGVNVFVYREYFHVFYIPIVPSGPKNVKLFCCNCREPKWYKDSAKLYEQASRTPFYFYSGIILFAALIICGVLANSNTQHEKAAFVAAPKAGDVYTIRKEENDSTFYYFLRLNNVRNDSVWTIHNNLVYYGFVSQFNNEDFFSSKEEVSYSKKELLELLENGTITAVDRNYGPSTGFDRIK